MISYILVLYLFILENARFATLILATLFSALFRRVFKALGSLRLMYGDGRR